MTHDDRELTYCCRRGICARSESAKSWRISRDELPNVLLFVPARLCCACSLGCLGFDGCPKFAGGHAKDLCQFHGMVRRYMSPVFFKMGNGRVVKPRDGCQFFLAQSLLLAQLAQSFANQHEASYTKSCGIKNFL
jgi:hypothetical protein